MQKKHKAYSTHLRALDRSSHSTSLEICLLTSFVGTSRDTKAAPPFYISRRPASTLLPRTNEQAANSVTMSGSAHVKVTVDVNLPRGPHHDTVATVLTRANPPLYITFPSVVGTKTESPINVLRTQVSRWEDFNLFNVTSAFGDILACEAYDGLHPFSLIPPGNLASLSTFDLTYFRQRLQSPMEVGLRVLAERSGRNGLTVATRQYQQLPGGFKPALGFVLPGNPEVSLASGLVRVSAAWGFDHIVTRANKNWDNPLHQLAIYSHYGRTRYGFVLTNEEVVVVRNFSENGLDFGIECQTIPWSASGENTLTVCLAVWALVMMALNDDHRAVRSRNDTLPLNFWLRGQDADGRVFYKHHLSLRETPVLPVGAVVMDMPAP